MSRAAISARVFAVYLFIIGPVLLIAPNFLLALFGLPPTSEVWIRLIGMLAVNIGVFSWVAAQHEATALLAASVYTRCAACAALTGFAMLGLAPPVIAVFGVMELLGAGWTWLALRADQRALSPDSPAAAGLR